MPEEPSRRGLLKAGLVSVVAATVPAVINAHSTPTVDELERDLGHPLPDEAKKLLKTALENNRSNAKERLKTELPDCSEPCFVYRPTGFVRKDGKK